MQEFHLHLSMQICIIVLCIYLAQYIADNHTIMNHECLSTNQCQLLQPCIGDQNNFDSLAAKLLQSHLVLCSLTWHRKGTGFRERTCIAGLHIKCRRAVARVLIHRKRVELIVVLALGHVHSSCIFSRQNYGPNNPHTLKLQINCGYARPISVFRRAEITQSTVFY